MPIGQVLHPQLSLSALSNLYLRRQSCRLPTSKSQILSPTSNMSVSQLFLDFQRRLLRNGGPRRLHHGHAADQVFSTYELLEIILDHVPATQLFNLQRVNIHFNSLINRSPLLRLRLLYPVSDYGYVSQEDLTDNSLPLYKLHTPVNPYTRKLIFALDTYTRHGVLPSGTWLNMLVYSPARAPIYPNGYGELLLFVTQHAPDVLVTKENDMHLYFRPSNISPESWHITNDTTLGELFFRIVEILRASKIQEGKIRTVVEIQIGIGNTYGCCFEAHPGVDRDQGLWIAEPIVSEIADEEAIGSWSKDANRPQELQEKIELEMLQPEIYRREYEEKMAEEERMARPGLLMGAMMRVRSEVENRWNGSPLHQRVRAGLAMWRGESDDEMED